MKKLMVIVIAVFCFAINTTSAQVALTFSTSNVDPLAGTVLNLAPGGSGSLFVWVDNTDASGNAIDGLSLDISVAGPSTLTANAFNIENPGLRWTLDNQVGTTTQGTLGVSPGITVDESNAGGFIYGPTSGIQNGAGPVLYAELVLTANNVEGVNPLTMSEGKNLISLTGVRAQSINFGPGSVNVAAVLGDLNGDGSLTNDDIVAFVLALTNSGAYATTYPGLNPNLLGDFNGDGNFTNDDILGFVAALTQ